MKNLTTLIILLSLSFQISAQTPNESEEKKENLVLIIKYSGGEYILSLIHI